MLLVMRTRLDRECLQGWTVGVTRRLLGFAIRGSIHLYLYLYLRVPAMAVACRRPTVVISCD